MAILFDEILTQGIRAGKIPAREQSAKNWYRETAKTYKRVNEGQLLRADRDRLRSRPIIGNMYMFMYEPKLNAELPDYDTFAVVFPIKSAKGGFLGINLHYLPLNFRATLMDALYDTVTNDAYDESTKLKISYDILNSASKFRYFKPCIKHYLRSQFRSRFLYIYPSEWDIALFLPLARFQKASKSTVYADSRKIIRNS